MLYYERKFRRQGCDLIIGVDEAGRGPLAGPVVAAAVALQDNRFKNRVDDSKKLTPLQRENAYLEIIDKSVFGIGIVNEKIIDKLNILVSTSIAMEQAVQSLIAKLQDCRKQVIRILVDGPVKLNLDFPVTNIIKGDSKSKSIAAASILAKVTRDRIMTIYDQVYPQYGFLKHKGYPTLMHRRQLEKFGFCLIHRRTFTGV
ncbi:MAG: ribonuclease HII [Candidatus Omnitrophota bacterium]